MWLLLSNTGEALDLDYENQEWRTVAQVSSATFCPTDLAAATRLGNHFTKYKASSYRSKPWSPCQLHQRWVHPPCNHDACLPLSQGCCGDPGRRTSALWRTPGEGLLILHWEHEKDRPGSRLLSSKEENNNGHRMFAVCLWLCCFKQNEDESEGVKKA